jgi:hypothetical protein
MARDRASIRLDMWADADWRALSVPAQRLYMLILSHPTLSYAGVADWRPGRIAQLSAGTTTEDINTAASELEAAGFILRDVGTEEVLIRSFVKHDGLMKQPKLVVSMTTAFAAIASSMLREVVAFEVQKLHARDMDRDPDKRLKWDVRQVQTVLAAKGSPIATFTHGVTHGLTPAVTPNGGQSQGLRTTTATATATEASLPDGEAKLKETRLPKDWAPTAAHLELARERRIDITAEVTAFRLHAETHDRHAARWNAAFTTWLKKAKPSAAASGGRQGMSLEEMRRRREEVMTRG